MTNADKILEKQGWRKDEFKDCIDYTKLNMGNYEEMHICISKDMRGVSINSFLTIPELKAIIKKVKELGI